MEDSLKQVIHSMVRLVVENMIWGSPCIAHCSGREGKGTAVTRELTLTSAKGETDCEWVNEADMR